jgi:hypothetical protein
MNNVDYSKLDTAKIHRIIEGEVSGDKSQTPQSKDLKVKVSKKGKNFHPDVIKRAFEKLNK